MKKKQTENDEIQKPQIIARKLMLIYPIFCFTTPYFLYKLIKGIKSLEKEIYGEVKSNDLKIHAILQIVLWSLLMVCLLAPNLSMFIGGMALIHLYIFNKICSTRIMKMADNIGLEYPKITWFIWVDNFWFYVLIIFIVFISPFILLYKTLGVHNDIVEALV